MRQNTWPGIFLLTCFVLPSPSEESHSAELLRRALYRADLYNWADAASDFAEAEKLFVAAGDQRNALYARLGRIRANIERDQDTLSAVTFQLGKELDSNPLLQSDRLLRMFCLIVKGDIDIETDTGAMRSDWQQVLDLARELGDEKWQYRALAQLGVAAFYDADLETARKNVGSALAAAAKAGDVGAQVRFLTILGNGLTQAKMHEQALPLLESALKLAAANPDIGYQFTVQEIRMTALIGLEMFDAAQRIADEALDEARRTKRAMHEATILARAASIPLARGDAPAALSLLKEAIAIAEPAGLIRVVAEARAMESDTYRGTGDLENAEISARLAADATRKSGNLWAVPQRLRALAELQVARGRVDEASRTYDLAEVFVDSLIGNAGTILEKTALIRASSDLFADHFALVAEHLNDPGKAYEIVEQVRGRVVGDTLMVGAVASSETQGSQRQISEVRLKLMAAQSASEARALRDQIFAAEQSRWTAPGLSIFKSQARSTARLVEVQRTLPPASVVLEYVLADPRSYCLVITRDAVRLVALPSRDRIESLTTAYLKTVRAKLAEKTEARRLYAALLGPVTEVGTARRLIIVRDGRLHLVPFGALRDPTGRFVIETKLVSYAPSVTSLSLLARQQRQDHAPVEFLGVGGVPYSQSGLTRAGLLHESDRRGFADLPSSMDEIRLARAALGKRSAKVLGGKGATEVAFKRTVAPTHRIIHIAAHGFADPAYPDRAALVLLSSPSEGEDGFLQAAEIAQLRLDADLVVLSSCDSAAGPLQGQDGIASLSRAFMLAGARSVVSTLWPVADDSSLYLVKRFYAHLAAKKPVPEALALAKRDMLRTFHSRAVPYHWAGFVAEGLPDRTVDVTSR